MNDKQINMYSTLLQLPLFQGISQDDLSEILGFTKFIFSRHSPGDVIIQSGHLCDSLVFLLKGSLSSFTYSISHDYYVEEIIPAPTLIEPENLFGLTQRYTSRYVSTEKSDMLSINKSEALKLLDQFDIIKYNLLNILTTHAQRLSQRPWRPIPHSRREKIIRFLSDHSRKPAGTKTFHIKMQQIASSIGESRLNVSKELHEMQHEGLLQLSRERIVIPALETLFT